MDKVFLRNTYLFFCGKIKQFSTLIRTIHTPPQTPPYHGTLNGHGQPKFGMKNGTLEQGMSGVTAPPPTIHAGVG